MRGSAGAHTQLYDRRQLERTIQNWILFGSSVLHLISHLAIIMKMTSNDRPTGYSEMIVGVMAIPEGAVTAPLASTVKVNVIMVRVESSEAGKYRVRAEHYSIIFPEFNLPDDLARYAEKHSHNTLSTAVRGLLGAHTCTKIACFLDLDGGVLSVFAKHPTLDSRIRLLRSNPN